MNCPNCGSVIDKNAFVCVKCGYLLKSIKPQVMEKVIEKPVYRTVYKDRSCGSVLKNENNQVNDQSATRQDYVANNVNSNIDNGSNQVVNSQNYGNTNFNPVGYNQANYTQENFNAQNTYNSSVNDSDSKVCVILSIAIPIVMFILKWFVGTSLYIDIIVATVGLTLAKKGESSSKPLAILGMILNVIFILLVIIFFLLTLYVVTCVD